MSKSGATSTPDRFGADSTPPQPGRRRFLGAGLALASGLWLPPALADSFDFGKGPRTLRLYRPKTREHLALTYLSNGRWMPEAYARICWLLRDIQTNQHVQMDVQLIAILDWTQQYLARYGYTAPLHILSGHRAPQTNARTEGASKDSLHMFGKAIDFLVPGLSTRYLGQLMNALIDGGVGVYVQNQFVHIDTGRYRRWQGKP